MTFKTKKEQAAGSNKERQKEIRRAVLLIKRTRESPPTDVIQKVGLWKLTQAIPDDIKREAHDIVESDDSVGGLAARVGGRQDLVKDKDSDQSNITVEHTEAQPASGDTASVLREITSQPNMIEALVADLKADGLEVTEEEVREYLAGVDFDAIVKEVGEAPV